MSSPKPAIDDVDDPLIGTTIAGKYRLRKLIGRGGVGLVYLATQTDDPAIERDVVVKVLAPNWARDLESVARFKREASRLSTLRHPNIVRMFDHGMDGNRAFLVMEYCQGELLSDYVKRNHVLSLEQFVPIAAQLLKGIGHCHSREMMVRDIKPANIMLVERKGRANFVKMLDFGLAKLINDTDKITEEHLLGTVGYLSPEQIKGQPIDLRVDVYAVGVLFYYMLSGRLPFDAATNAAVFYQTVNDPAPDLREMVPEGSEIPRGLVHLIHGCLEKDRDRRPADGDAIVENLIDVVPAALFRLARADAGLHGAASNVVPLGHGDTGMMELLRAQKKRSRPEVEPPPTSPESNAPTFVAAGSDAPRLLGVVGTVERSQRTPWLAGLAMLTGAAIAAWASSGDSEPASPAPTIATAADPEPAASPTEETVAQRLERADDELAAGRLDAAGSMLDAVADAASADPTTRAYHIRLRRDLDLQRAMRAGERLERQGQHDPALAAYGDALAIDPTHAPARLAVARLSERAPESPPEATTERGPEAVAEPSPRRRGTPSATATRPTAEPAPAADSEATPQPEPSSKPSPFLPTKDKDKDSVFLPTKD